MRVRERTVAKMRAQGRRWTARGSSGAPLAALLALPCAGCLTITSSSYQRIPVATEPPGAVARSGDAACRTPCELEVPRADPKAIEVTLDRYEPVYVPLDRYFRAAWLWNLVPPLSLVLVAVPPLWTADFLSGTVYRLEPQRLSLSLRLLATDGPTPSTNAGTMDAAAPGSASAAQAGPAGEEASQQGATSRPTFGSRRPEPWSRGKATVFWTAYDLRGVELGVRLLLPPWEIGAGGGWHGVEPRLDAGHVALEAGAGVDISKWLRATLLAEGGFIEYWVPSPSNGSGWLDVFQTTKRLVEGGSASFPFIGARASLGFRLGRRGWLTLGVTGFARASLGVREIPYAIETCSTGLFGGTSCRTERGSARAGGEMYGVGLLVGSRFDWKD